MTPLLVAIQMRLHLSRIIDQHEEDGNAAAAEAVRRLFDLARLTLTFFVEGTVMIRSLEMAKTKCTGVMATGNFLY